MFYAKTGNTYEGTFLNDTRSGKNCQMRYDNGDVYEGDYKKNERHGNGKYLYANGDIYQGNWKDNRFSGRGKFINANGRETFDGYWKSGKKHGLGTWFKDGITIEGTWENDKLTSSLSNSETNDEIKIVDGKVQRVENVDDLFECILSDDGLPDMCRYPNGDTYRGQWKDGKRHGQGQMIYNIGSVYVGQWKENMKHGKGKYISGGSFKGNIYEGQWLEDKSHGFGKAIYGNGNIYTGHFTSGRRNGKGSMIYSGII